MRTIRAAEKQFNVGFLQPGDYFAQKSPRHLSTPFSYYRGQN